MNQRIPRRTCALVLTASLAAQPWITVCGAEDADAVHDAGPWPRHVVDDSLRGADGVKLADFDGDGHLDIVTGWEESGLTRVYRNPGPSEVGSAWPSVTVGRTPSVEDAVPIDLDGDGFLDVLSLCEGNTSSIFVHWGRHTADARSILDHRSWKQEQLVPPLPQMMWMFATAGRKGAADEPLTLFAGGKGGNAMIGRILALHEVEGRATTSPSLQWHPLSHVGWVMSILATDMDGDGDQDVLLSDRRGPLRGVRWLENPLPSGDEAVEWTNHFLGGRDREVMFLTTADWDGDGRQDVLAAVKPANVLWFRRLDANGEKWQVAEIGWPQRSGTAKAVAVGDLDCNGVSDLVVTCERAHDDRSGVWWLPRGASEAPSEAPSAGVWHDISGSQGTKYDLVELVDLDRDGDLDVLTCEEAWHGRGLGVVWYENPLE